MHSQSGGSNLYIPRSTDALSGDSRPEDGSEVDIEIAVREALTNAVVHGNHEDPNKRVFVTSRCSEDGEVSITVCDEGQGFDSRAVPDPRQKFMRKGNLLSQIRNCAGKQLERFLLTKSLRRPA